MEHSFFSIPQIFGYLTFVCGMVTFLQKNDRHFKYLLTLQNTLYGVHFFLMGNPAAVAGMVLSILRNVLSLRTRSLWVAVLLLVLNVLVGCWVVTSWWYALPLLAAAVATLSMFRLQGAAMRVGMLCATLLWDANNILTGSIGGTAMETTLAVISIVTIVRIRRDARQAGGQVPVRGEA